MNAQEASYLKIWLDVIGTETEKLNDWERHFITDMQDKFDREEPFSVKQFQCVNKIYEKVV